jgi:hypothetical protein
VAALFLVAGTCADPAARWLAGNAWADRPGMTYLSRPETAGPAGCAQACLNDVECEAWSYEASFCHGGTSDTTGTCQLKHAVPRLAPWSTDAGMPACTRASGVKRAATQGLVPLRYKQLPVGEVHAEGWLRQQLMVMANGLSGHLDLFWADVQQSVWCVPAPRCPLLLRHGSAALRGTAPSQHDAALLPCTGSEAPRITLVRATNAVGTRSPSRPRVVVEWGGEGVRRLTLAPPLAGPYWLNGMVSLVAQLNATGDIRLVNVDVNAQVNFWITYILDHQLPSGWLGPDDVSGPPLATSACGAQETRTCSRRCPFWGFFGVFLVGSHRALGEPATPTGTAGTWPARCCSMRLPWAQPAPWASVAARPS